MYCYGKFFDRLDQCAKCSFRRYCRNAADPKLLIDRAPPELTNEAILNRCYGQDRRSPFSDERPRYSRAELLEVIGFMASLDHRMLKLLEYKIRDPTLNLSELAAKNKVSRQAIHKQVRQKLEQIPELASIITYRRKKRELNRKTTFLEEVCQIRKKMQEERLRRQKPAWNCLKRWNFSNRSLLSSPTSIIKGSSIWKND